MGRLAGVVVEGDRVLPLLVHQHSLGQGDQLVAGRAVAGPCAEPREEPLGDPFSAPQRAFRHLALERDPDARSVATHPFTTSLRSEHHLVTGFSLHTGTLSVVKGANESGVR